MKFLSEYIPSLTPAEKTSLLSNSGVTQEYLNVLRGVYSATAPTSQTPSTLDTKASNTKPFCVLLNNGDLYFWITSSQTWKKVSGGPASALDINVVSGAFDVAPTGLADGVKYKVVAAGAVGGVYYATNQVLEVKSGAFVSLFPNIFDSDGDIKPDLIDKRIAKTGDGAFVRDSYNTVVPAVTKAQAEAGVSTVTATWTPLRVKEAIVALNGSSSVVNKIDATTAPSVSNDSSQSYSVGSFWVDVNADKAYRCVDSSVGAAVWINTTLSTTDLSPIALSGSTSDALVQGSSKLLMTPAERTAIAANSSKTSNANHTGEVTGSTSLTIQPSSITGKTSKTTLVGADQFLVSDSQASGALKRASVEALLGGGVDIASNATDPKFTTAPTQIEKLLLRWDTKKMYGSENVTVVGEPTAATQITDSTAIGRGAIFMNNGSLLVSLLNDLEIKIVAHPLSTPYDVSTKGTQVYSQAINTAFAGAGNTLPSNRAYTLSKLSDDSKLYIISSDSIHQFNLATAGNLSTMTFAFKHSGISNYGIAYAISPDGSKLLEVNGLGSNSKTYTMTGGNLSSLTLFSTFANVKISGYLYFLYTDNTGINFIGVGDTTGSISKITLSSANDFNSTSTSGATLSISNANAGGLFWDSQSGHLMVQGSHSATDTDVYRSATTSIAWQPFSFT